MKTYRLRLLVGQWYVLCYSDGNYSFRIGPFLYDLAKAEGERLEAEEGYKDGDK